MEMSLFSDEQIMKAYTKDIERQTAERVERETAQKEAREFAVRLLKRGTLSNNDIAELTNLSVNEVNELKNKIDSGEK